MRTVGIIAECNPFHEGHVYLLREARRVTGADYVAVVMSGDFVQRGTPAIMDKRTRAHAVLENGADLVLELPLYVSCGSAGYFAAGAVRLLESLGVVTDLCFGSESGDTGTLLRAASQMETPDFETAVGESLRAGLSYPSAMAHAMKKHGVFLSDSAPNDLLAVGYCRELLRTGSGITPHAILRCQAEGASDIRRRLLSESTGSGRARLLSEEDLSDMLLHALLYSPLPLTEYQDVSPDLESRIRAFLPQYRDFDSFCAMLKNKSITYTRLRRALLHILLDLRAENVRLYQEAGYIGYLRPLGFRSSASPLLREIDRCRSVPFLSRLAADRQRLPFPFSDMLEEDLRASDFCAGLRQRRLASAGCPGDGAVPEPAQPLIIL